MDEEDENYDQVEDDDGVNADPNLESALPNLGDPDFAQFSRYLGVDIDQIDWNSCTASTGTGGVSNYVSQSDVDQAGSTSLTGASSGSGSDDQQQQQQKINLNLLALTDPINASLLKIVQEAYVAPLPPAWSEYADPDGRIYFYNYVTEQSSWAHPTDRTYKELIQIVKKVKAANLGRVETMRIIDVHLQSVHSRALEALQGFSGPYVSEDGHPYFYNEITDISTWESPIMEWEHNISTRYHVLYRCLIENQFTEEDSLNAASTTVINGNDSNNVPTLPPPTLGKSTSSIISGLKLQLPLHLLSHNPGEATDNNNQSSSQQQYQQGISGGLGSGKSKFEPPTPSTSRSFHTARSQSSARTHRAKKDRTQTNLNTNGAGSGSQPNSDRQPESPKTRRTVSGGEHPVSPKGTGPQPPKKYDEYDDDDDEEPFNFTFGTTSTPNLIGQT